MPGTDTVGAQNLWVEQVSSPGLPSSDPLYPPLECQVRESRNFVFSLQYLSSELALNRVSIGCQSPSPRGTRRRKV